jgi:quinol monooxygenase YgiN
MTTVGLIVRFQAKPGKEDELADFLRSAVPLVQAEPATTAWFALQIDTSTFAIVDAFPDQAGRQAHLDGAVAAALFGKADELLAEAPTVEQVDVLADVLPA